MGGVVEVRGRRVGRRGRLMFEVHLGFFGRRVLLY
jgi:hypothetical protein